MPRKVVGVRRAKRTVRRSRKSPKRSSSPRRRCGAAKGTWHARMMAHYRAQHARNRNYSLKMAMEDMKGR